MRDEGRTSCGEIWWWWRPQKLILEILILICHTTQSLTNSRTRHQGTRPPTASRQRGGGSLFKFLLFSSSNPPESFGSRTIFLWLELFLVVESVKRPPRGKLLCLEPHMGLVVNFFLQKSKHFVSPKLQSVEVEHKTCRSTQVQAILDQANLTGLEGRVREGQNLPISFFGPMGYLSGPQDQDQDPKMIK